MTNNAHKAARQQGKRAANNTQFVIGRVEEIAQDKHMISANIQGEDADEKAVALSTRLGDVSLPDIDEHVLIGYAKSGMPVSFGSVYFEDDGVPSFSPSDRRVGNSSSGSNMTIGSGGDVSISASEQSATSSPEAAQEESENNAPNFELDPDGTMRLSNNNEGSNIELANDGTITASNDNGSASVVIQPDGTMQIEADAEVSVNSNSVDVTGQDINVRGSSVTVDSSNVHLGPDDVEAKGVAREDDEVQLKYGGPSTITQGSTDIEST